jgi:DNA-binding CsgD family transcriptional regulator
MHGLDVRRSLAGAIAPPAAAAAAPEGGDSPGIAAIIRPLERLARSNKVAAFGVSLESGRAALSFTSASRGLLAAGPAAFASVIQARPRDFAAFDTACPEPCQRNVVVLRREIDAWARVDALPVARDAFPVYGLSRDDFMRVLVCDGPSLLAWVGAFRREPFAERERQAMQRVVPALKRRLREERLLRELDVAAAALGAALEAIGSPAFVTHASGRVAHANSLGRVLLDRDRRAVEGTLRDAVTGRGAEAYAVTRLAAAGAPDHFLLVRSAPAADSACRVEAAASRWDLTPRQKEVLALVATGKCNKSIAAELSCAERTVEFHVSACLCKARCEKRAELVAKVWS